MRTSKNKFSKMSINSAFLWNSIFVREVSVPRTFFTQNYIQMLFLNVKSVALWKYWIRCQMDSKSSMFYSLTIFIFFSMTSWKKCDMIVHYAGTLRHSTKHDVLKIPRNVKWRHYDVINMTPYYYRYRLLIAGIGSNFRINLFYVLTTTTFCCVYQNNYV